jgi:hypothetical protein
MPDGPKAGFTPEEKLSLAMKIFAVLILLGLPIGAYGYKKGYVWYADVGPNYLSMGMLLAIFVTLAVNMFIGSFDIRGSKHLLNFIIWSFTVHGLVMVVQGLQFFGKMPSIGSALNPFSVEFPDAPNNPHGGEWPHFMPYGDIAACFIMPGVLQYLKSKVDFDRLQAFDRL